MNSEKFRLHNVTQCSGLGFQRYKCGSTQIVKIRQPKVKPRTHKGYTSYNCKIESSDEQFSSIEPNNKAWRLAEECVYTMSHIRQTSIKSTATERHILNKTAVIRKYGKFASGRKKLQKLQF